MRNVRSVYQKLREVKYHYLVKIYKRYFKRIPENCMYNHPYTFSTNNHRVEIRLCLLHQPNLNLKSGVFPHLIEICHEVHHCNGFIPRYTKQDIQKLFEEELKNKKIKEKKYTDICALEWILEQSVLGIPPLNWIQKVYFTIKKQLSKNRVL